MQVDCPECGHVLEFSSERPLFCAYCGKPLSRPEEATAPLDPNATQPVAPRPGGKAREAPASVGRYRLLRWLGDGGMGTVYEAVDAHSGRHVALKLIAPEYAGSPTAVERFRQEGRLASLIAHPRCVFVFAADEDAGRPYIVMELMPGGTLQELADRKGPLPPAEAVAKILDVIEGLQEAHRLGVIHRDVKPSNCFLLPDGRVKVGDFGLAKSLVGSASLTRTGTFLGTLLYAPPEQIKGEGIDVRTDVYSVAATLYHLLTGRAPYEGKDAAATLARTVSERAPRPRSLRPDLPRALERVVLRGLERDRDDRWRDLEEFRQALLPFTPARLAPAGPGPRLGAFLIDFGLVLPLMSLLLLMPLGMADREDVGDLRLILIRVLEMLPLALLEGLCGWSPGKWLLRLRVVTATGTDPPGLWRGLARTLAFYGCIFLVHDVIILLNPVLLFNVGRMLQPGLVLLAVGSEVLGVLLVLAPMRARNGYRGLHEWISGTRVVRLPWPERRHTYRPRHPERQAPVAPRLPGLPERLGPYLLRGTLREAGGERLLLAEDAVLGRQVWLRVRPAGKESLPAWRRELSRPTRLPWLAGGEQDGLAWDAFLAPQGRPLADLVEPHAPLTWGQVRPLLLQLSDELVAACADGSVPRPLTAAQVWVQDSGRVQLLDTPLAEPPTEDRDCPGATDSARALALLRRVAVLALEGRLRPEPDGTRVHAPAPASARLLLNRLMGVEQPDTEVEQVQADLIALQGEPTEVTRAARSAQLALLLAMLAPFLLVMLMTRYVAMQRNLYRLHYWVELAEKALDYTDRPEHSAAVAEWMQGHRYLARHTPAEWRELIRRQLREDREDLESLQQVAKWDWPARLMLLDTYRDAVAEFGQDDFWRAASHADPGHPAPRGDVGLVPDLVAVIAPPLLCVLWALLTRGGLTFRLAGLSLRRGSGRRAGRLQCAWRALVFWAPVVALLGLSVWVQTEFPGRPLLAFGLWCAAVGVLVGYVLLALWSPARGPHDRLAGTYLVPR
jgi:hypothetical protein